MSAGYVQPGPPATPPPPYLKAGVHRVELRSAVARMEKATEIVWSVVYDEWPADRALRKLRFWGLTDDEAALNRAAEAMELRDEVLGCPSQVERYVDVSPIEGVHRAHLRFVDDQQDVLDLAVQELSS